METNRATPLRLLFVTSGLTRGGAEGFLVRLVLRLSARGHVCAVAALGSQGPLATTLAEGGVDVVQLGNGLVRCSLRLSRVAARFRPDVMQGWMYRGNLAALFAAALSGRKPALVWSVRQGLNDLAESPWPTRLSVFAGAHFSRRADAIVYNAHSAEDQHEAHGFAAARSRVIPNGIEVAARPTPESRASVRSRLGFPDGAFVVALIARWHPVKNHRGFARAAGRLARWRPEARFLLAGQGIDATNATLAGWLAEEGIADRALLLGERADVPDLLEAADVVTLASHGEAFPNALLEAMAAGRPCVAPDVGDIAALFGPTGVIVPAGDDDALAAGWESLAAMTSEKRRALGEAGRARIVELYGLDRAVSAFESVYEDAAGR